MITLDTPAGPITISDPQTVDAIRRAFQQRYDDGLAAGYQQAKREEEQRERRYGIRPIFVGIDLAALDLAA